VSPAPATYWTDDPAAEDDVAPIVIQQHREFRMPDTIRNASSYYVHLRDQALAKLQLPETATLDDFFKRVIHGDVNQELSFDAAFEVAMRAWKNQDRA
jgi:hypothetical protein